MPKIMSALMYGSGLRLLECACLRVKDLDFSARQIQVRQGKGRKDRLTLLPEQLRLPLSEHLTEVKAQHLADSAAGAGHVALPGALERKLPHASQSWPWQWVFPATRLYVDRRTGERRRHHLHETESNARFTQRFEGRESASTPPATRSAIASPPTSSKPATTSAPPRAARPQRCEHNDDLHPCPEPRPLRRPPPFGLNRRATPAEARQRHP